MIRPLAEAVNDPDPAPSLCGGGEDGVGEGNLVHHLRAAESEHKTSRSHLGDRCGVQALISPQGILQRIPVLGECRRVNYDEIILSLPAGAQILYGISADVLPAPVLRSIEGEISVGKGYGLGRRVH